MGQIKETAHRGKLFFALLGTSPDIVARATKRLALDFSAIQVASSIMPFTHTNYYAGEMGDNLVRQWIATTNPILITELPDIKQYTNRLEDMFARDRHRQVNIDPGYLTLSKVVLATTKDYDHRLYVASGIYEEVTLHYKRQGGWEAWPWTYPDYRSPDALKFFAEVRERLASETAA